MFPMQRFQTEDEAAKQEQSRCNWRTIPMGTRCLPRWSEQPEARMQTQKSLIASTNCASHCSAVTRLHCVKYAKAMGNQMHRARPWKSTLPSLWKRRHPTTTPEWPLVERAPQRIPAPRRSSNGRCRDVIVALL